MDASSLEAAAHSILLNETVYKKLAADKKRPLFLHEWLCYLEKNLTEVEKLEIKKIQPKITAQLFSLFNAFPGPPIRHLIARNLSTLFSIGDILALHQTIEKCNDMIRSKEHETQMNQMAKLCALNVIGSLYEKLGRMVGYSCEETVQVLLKYMKSADSQVRIEIIQTFEKILLGLGTAGQSIHKDIYKQLKDMMSDRVQAVRCASIKCLCEMIKHSTFLYLSPSSSSLSTAQNAANNSNNSISHELDSNVKLCFKALDNSNYDVRCSISTYLAQLIFYSISQIQQKHKQLQIQQQMSNASISSVGGGDGETSSTKQQRQHAIQQQQNALALQMTTERTKSTLMLLANGFWRPNTSTSSFNYVRGAASSLAASAGSKVSGSSLGNSPITSNNHSNLNASMDDSSLTSPSIGDLGSNKRRQNSPAVSTGSSSGSLVNREVRIGVTYAYVELANLLGTQWLEKNLKIYLTHVLNLVNNTKAVSTHLDAVYSRKCVQFILRAIIGGMLNEKVQLEAARELVSLIDKCMNGVDLSEPGKNSNTNNPQNIVTQQQHVLICALYELSCILKCLNTSASILVNDDIKMVDRILACLMHPNIAVKCVSAWCLRTLAYSLPAMMTPLLDNCMDRLSLIRNLSDALVGYGYACAALLGAIHACPLGVPHLKPKLAFNIGEELLRTASQSNNIQVALHKTSTGWLLLGAFMTMGSTIVCKHLRRMKKLWNLTMPTTPEQLESEKKRGDLFTWQLSLESRQGALASIHSFLVNCSDLLGTSNDSIQSPDSSSPENSIMSILAPIEGAILLLSQLPNIIKQNNNSVVLKAQSATFRLKLYQTLIAMPSAQFYENNFAVILRELVAEFTLADQQASTLVTSSLRSVCHSNDSILFANCWLQDADFKEIEEQLQPSSASGCEALEHDVTYLYQKTNSSQSSSSSLNSLYSTTTSKKQNAATINSSSAKFSSLQTAYSNSIVCLAALPLGVSVIDAAIQLFGLMYPKVPNKHRLQMLLHFTECIQKQATSKANAACKQAMQINIFTAVLGSLKSLAETKTELGDDSIRKATLKLVMETLCHSNPILRCAAGEALGRMTQVIGESHFVVEVAQFCFEKLRNSKDEFSKTGYALGLGCLHRYLGTMGAGQHMTSSLSILFALAQNSSSSIVQVWAIHALYLITDSGGSMFRNYIEPCVEFIVQSVLSIPYTNRDVFVGLGKLLNSLITFMGPELQMDSASDMRVACLTTCTIMQIHSDSMIRAEAIKCLQELHLFTSKYVNLNELVPHLLNSLVSKDFLLRKVAISCLRQLCQKDSIDVCNIAEKYVHDSKPIGLISIIGERGLECLLFKMLDIETNPYLIRDIHDILNSLLCTLLNEFTLKQWLFLCKDIAISTEGNEMGGDTDQNFKSKSKETENIEARSEDLEGNDDENDENYDDSESFQIPKKKDPKGSGNSYDPISDTLKLKQITKMISPKWPNRVFAVDLIRRIIQMCASDNYNASSSADTDKFDALQERTQSLNKKANFDLNLAKKLRNQQQENNKPDRNLEANYLILFLQDLMRIACIAASGSSDTLKLAGLDLLNDLILNFAHVEEPNPEFKGHLILEQYQAQVSAALRPQFSIETSAHVTAKACQVCSMWISSGIARDLNDLRRVHQLLVSSLQKLTSPTINKPQIVNMSASTENLIYSELSLTVEKLAVLRAWAEVYIVAQRNAIEKKLDKTKKKSEQALFNSGSESLLSLVQPELALLSFHWSVALKDYAYLSLPNEYACQLPIEGGAFYHADLVENSRPIYKEHFTKILLAYSIWLSEIEFDIQEQPANQPKPFQVSKSNGDNAEDPEVQLIEPKERIFFMLLGLSLEHLSNTTGLAQLSDETIEDILESINYLLRTSIAKELLGKKSGYLCVEILSILYKVKLTRDLMNINLLVLRIVSLILTIEHSKPSTGANNEDQTPTKAQKNSSSLVFVILEICIRDLIKYAPNLLDTNETKSPAMNRQKSSFLYMHIVPCKLLNHKDVELIRCLMNILNKIPFQPDIRFEKKISLVSIIFHIQFNLLQSIEPLLNKSTGETDKPEIEFYEAIFDSFKVICSTSSPDSKYYLKDDQNKDEESVEPSQKLIELQQTALMNTLNLKSVENYMIMKLLSIFFQYCSMRVFEPLNVYEKCKVFMCSMRCSDNGKELLCMIQSLNEILSNKDTKKELRIVLLKEHLSYLLKLTSTTSSIDLESDSYCSTNSHFLTKTSEEGVQLIKSLLNLLESMVNLMSEDSKEQETLTVFVHILATYLSENNKSESLTSTSKKYINELNELVLNKLINLGTNHKQDFKQVLNKWPEVKTKIENAFKLSASEQQTPKAQNSMSVNQRQVGQVNVITPSVTSSQSKAPKIQLKTFGNFK